MFLETTPYIVMHQWQIIVLKSYPGESKQNYTNNVKRKQYQKWVNECVECIQCTK